MSKSQIPTLVIGHCSFIGHSGLVIGNSRNAGTYAAIEAPPGRFVPTAVAAGPFCLRSLNQKPVNQTFDPGATVSGNTMLTTVLLVTPSKLQSPSLVGAEGPTNVKILAPLTPSGFPRFVDSPAACRRIFTVFSTVETMSI